MSPEILQQLEGVLKASATGLPKVTTKKMFGCQALWADGNVFALVWKRGRIGVKLPDEAAFNELMDQSGSEPWKAGPMTMGHWVLVPAEFHSAQRKQLDTWLRRAHTMALVSAPKAKAQADADAKPKTAKAKSPAKKR